MGTGMEAGQSAFAQALMQAIQRRNAQTNPQAQIGSSLGVNNQIRENANAGFTDPTGELAIYAASKPLQGLKSASVTKKGLQ